MNEPWSSLRKNLLTNYAISEISNLQQPEPKFENVRAVVSILEQHFGDGDGIDERSLRRILKMPHATPAELRPAMRAKIGVLKDLQAGSSEDAAKAARAFCVLVNEEARQQESLHGIGLKRFSKRVRKRA